MREWQDILWCETDDETGILSGEYASKKTERFKAIFFLNSEVWLPEYRNCQYLLSSVFIFTQNPLPGSSQHQAARDLCQEFCNGCLSSGKTDGSLLYIYLYLPSNKHFNLNTITHTLVCFKTSFNNIYVLCDLRWHWFCLSNMVKIKASFSPECRTHNLPWQGNTALI